MYIMDIYTYATLLIILIVIILYLSNNKLETFNTFVGRLAIDDQYFYDKLFDDVYYYPNENDWITGWSKCKTECPGHCVEFGITGNAYCFAR